MSGTSTAKGPCPAYLEEVHEDSQTPISGSRQTANTAAKRSKDGRRSKRDGESDSGYSSRTVATTGSSSLESKSGSGPKNVITRFTQNLKMASSGKRSQNKEPSSPSKSHAKKSLSRQAKNVNLRHDAAPCESREAAAKMQLSGDPVKRRQSNAVHHDAPETHKAQPSTKSNGVPPSSARAIPIQNIAPNPPQRRLSHEARSAPRPASYAGPHMSPAYLHHPPQIVQQRPVLPQLTMPSTMPNTMYAPVYSSPAIAMAPAPLPTAPNRQISYAYPPTPQYHPIQQPPPEILYPQQPTFSYAPAPVSRRLSTNGVPLVEYSAAPAKYYILQHPGSDHTSRRRSIAFADDYPIIQYTTQDEAVSIEDPGEGYYRKPMAPPRRPAMRQSATTPAIVSKRPDEGSRVMPSRSPQKQSFEEPRSGSRPSRLSRTPSTKSTARTVEAPMPPTATDRRHSRSRPMSYHEPTDAVRQAEAYQEDQKGQARHGPVTATDWIAKTHRKAQKTNSKAGSETGSRTSTSRSGSGAKKRESMGLSIQTKEGMRVEYSDDGTLKVWRNHNKDSPAEMTVAGSRSSKYRDERSRVRGSGSERDKRYSISVNHEPGRIEGFRESRAGSRHRSRTRQLVPLRDRRSSEDEHEAMIRSLRAEVPRSIRQEHPIEDDEESETAKQVERVPTERVQRLRTESRSRSRRSSTRPVNRLSMAQRPVHSTTEFGGEFF